MQLKVTFLSAYHSSLNVEELNITYNTYIELDMTKQLTVIYSKTGFLSHVHFGEEIDSLSHLLTKFLSFKNMPNP